MRPTASLRGTTRLILIQVPDSLWITSSCYADGLGGDNTVDDPGGETDDPGGGSTNDWSSCNNFTISASSFSKASASYVSSSLTTRVSLLSLSDKSTADAAEYANVDYATGSFCSSCSIPPHMARGLWSSGKGCAMCNNDDNVEVDLGSL